MSFFDNISINVVAENLASGTFNQVAVDAGAMASQISVVSESMSSEFGKAAESAVDMSSQIGVVSGSVSSAFDEAAKSAADMSSQVTETTNTVTYLGSEVARTSSEVAGLAAAADAGKRGLEEMGDAAEGSTIKLTTVARGLSSIASFGSAVTVLAADVGLVDKETGKWMSTVLAAVTVVSAFARLQAYTTLLTTGETAAIGVNTTAQTANTSSSLALAAAHQIKAAATWIATTAQNALNISQATFLALTGVGIGVIIAAAAAMAYFASQMNNATSSVQNFNVATANMPTAGRNIQRSGESTTNQAALYRRGVE